MQQTLVYAEAVERLGARSRWIDLDGEQVLALERGPLRMVLRGPVWPTDADAGARAKAVRRLARWPGLTVVTPEDTVAGFGLIPLVTPTHQAIWSLGAGLRAGMTQSWRNALSQAERAGIRVTRGGPATQERLIAAEAVKRAARGYRSLPPRFTRALPADALRLWEWRAEGGMQAAMAFIRHGAGATYHLAWGSDLARQKRVHHLMLTRAAEALAGEGVRWLDLGSVDTDRAPGLARFKLGTGAALRRLGATLLVLP